MLLRKHRGSERCCRRRRRSLSSRALVAAAAASTLSTLLLLLLLLPPTSAARPLSLPPLPFFPLGGKGGRGDSAGAVPGPISSASSMSSFLKQEEEGKKPAGEKKPAAAEKKKLAEPASDHEASYGHFADLLASVLVLREGGVSEALDALPTLHDTTDAYVRTLSIIRAHEWGTSGGIGGSVFGPASKWRGLTDNAVLHLANLVPNTTKNSNYTDPLAASGQQLQAALDEKWGPEPALGWERK